MKKKKKTHTHTTTTTKPRSTRSHAPRSCILVGPPGVSGIWGELLFIFRELGSTGNFFHAFGEQAHNFGDLGSSAKKEIKKISP